MCATSFYGLRTIECFVPTGEVLLDFMVIVNIPSCGFHISLYRIENTNFEHDKSRGFMFNMPYLYEDEADIANKDIEMGLGYKQ